MRDDIDDYLPVVFKKLSWLTREELITRVVALNFNRFLDYYKDAKDLNIDENSGKEKREKKEKKQHDDSHMVRLFFGMGKRDHIKPNSLIGRINDVTGTKDIEIGHIDLMENFSFVAVDGDKAQFIVDCFADPTKNRDGIRVEITTGEPKDKTDKKKSDRINKIDRIEQSDKPKREKKSRDSFHEERRRRDRDEEKQHSRRSRKQEKDSKKTSKKKKKSRENERPERKYGKRVRY